ncbi:hypothetical protein CFP56_010884 [Quercus suber]|uniref:Uncharacterized protein n=1 Tax=Quercus suber TaxID=58331 RepID=A0AAW0KZT6_QUESU
MFSRALETGELVFGRDKRLFVKLCESFGETVEESFFVEYIRDYFTCAHGPSCLLLACAGPVVWACP